MSKKAIYDEFDPWVHYNPSAPALVRRNPNRTRVRKPGVAKQAAKADFEVALYEVDDFISIETPQQWRCGVVRNITNLTEAQYQQQTALFPKAG
jgi:hypothetical protein